MTPTERQRRHRGELTTPPMTKAEVLGLQSLIRQREKVLKSAAAQRSAELMADFEQQLASEYSWDQDEIWKQAADAAARAIDEAKATITARCLELGIPAKFAPGIGMYSSSRGENALKERRTELRAVAKTRIAAIEKETCLKIELHSVELQTQILAQGLTSEAARSFLESMPAVETLMPTLELTKIEHMLENRKRSRPTY
jgi:hypothetical protein